MLLNIFFTLIFYNNYFFFTKLTTILSKLYARQCYDDNDLDVEILKTNYKSLNLEELFVV